MNKNDWLLMTYYCPTHGKQNRSNQIELTKKNVIDIKTKKKNKVIIN